MFKKLLVVIMSYATLSGCVVPGVNNQTVGAGLGAGVGGMTCASWGKGYRHNPALVLGCAMVGAVVGSSVGRSIDEVDRMKTQQAIMQAPTNQTTSWYNPNNGNQYAVTPVNNPMQYNNGTVCRDFTTIATIEGQRQRVNGRACRMPDGSWQMQ